MERVVARLGRAHGLGGDVTAEVLTDVPQQRFGVGQVLRTDAGAALTLAAAREHSGTWLLRFVGHESRVAAEGLRGVKLLLDIAASDEPDAWYADELVGLAAVTPTGAPLGIVTGLETAGAQDLLLVKAGTETIMVPFVTALVPVVDLPGQRVVIDPPDGLFPTGPS